MSLIWIFAQFISHKLGYRILQDLNNQKDDYQDDWSNVLETGNVERNQCQPDGTF